MNGKNNYVCVKGGGRGEWNLIGIIAVIGLSP